MNLLQEAISICISNNIPFVAYTLPETNEQQLIIQLSELKKAAKDSLNQQGFIVAPFSENETTATYFISADLILSESNVQEQHLSQLKSINLTIEKQNYDSIVVERQEHIALVEQMISAIKKGHLNKAIASRIKQVNIENHSPSEVYFQLSENYPKAFVYLMQLPGVGIWLGATPETLLSIHQQKASTMALAGTLPLSNTPKWTQKEIEEQAIVARYIVSLLEDFEIESYSKEGPETVQAGNVMHLKTSFSWKIPNNFPTDEFIQKLHPTPAVCGLPKQEAMNLIKETEQHNRSYYSGYLGPVNINSATNLFVNLRCMRWNNESISLFVGGGITADSNPENEWNETELKAQTLLSVIEKM